MTSRLAGAALALSFTLAQLAATPAYAEQAPAAPFRSVAAQSFSAQDLRAYGLDESAARRAEALQQQGYAVKVLTPEEAQQYQAGITDSEWLLIGILAGVIVIAVAVAD